MEPDYLQRRKSGSVDRGPPPICIETLPGEIQREIMLWLPSLGSLGAIIRTSPVFYSLFRREPKKFILNCLIIVLGDSFIDTCTAHAAMQDDFQRRRRDAMKLRHEPSMIWPFLESYRNEAKKLDDKSWRYSVSLEKAVQMATFHATIVEPLVEQYSSWAMTNLGTSVKPKPLSSTECMRIQRGMYRFQILCDVFGNRLKDHNISSNRPRHLGCLRFLSRYEPWEIEEILCINAFFEEKYEARLSEVSDDLKPSNHRFNGHSFPGEPEHAFDFERGGTRVNCRNFLVSQGLPLFASISRIHEHEELVNTMQANMLKHASEYWLGDVTGNTDMHERWETSYSERDAAQDEGRPMPFVGDDLNSPPLAWVLIWGEAYSNLFGTFIPRPLRLWGYIMWDAWRLKEDGAKEVLMREWYEMWQDGDYRDNLRAWNNRG
ncbi:hypothetical protein N8I77_000104 [Diaporthe amygdali]|uniref:F-box domain-containing protein n=1 Tax=Phomopsis amygdali TaxID=1214568 RepID=A0AAD9SPC7_PHOAM|nr:hypothetical protein N8I77_000104 [Diaporthe amygdali]